MNRKEFFIGLYNPLIFAAVVLLILEDGPDIDVYSSFLVSGGVFLNVSGSGSFFGFNGREVSEGAKLVVNQELLQIPVSQPCGAPYIPTVIPKASGDGGDEPPAAPTSLPAFSGVPPDGPLIVYYMNELSEDTRPASNNSLPSSPRPSPVDPDSAPVMHIPEDTPQYMPSTSSQPPTPNPDESESKFEAESKDPAPNPDKSESKFEDESKEPTLKSSNACLEPRNISKKDKRSDEPDKSESNSEAESKEAESKEPTLKSSNTCLESRNVSKKDFDKRSDQPAKSESIFGAESEEPEPGSGGFLSQYQTTHLVKSMQQSNPCPPSPFLSRHPLLAPVMHIPEDTPQYLPSTSSQPPAPNLNKSESKFEAKSKEPTMKSSNACLESRNLSEKDFDKRSDELEKSDSNLEHESKEPVMKPNNARLKRKSSSLLEMEHRLSVKHKESLKPLNRVMSSSSTNGQLTTHIRDRPKKSILLNIPSDGSFFGHYRHEFYYGARAAASHDLVPDLNFNPLGGPDRHEQASVPDAASFPEPTPGPTPGPTVGPISGPTPGAPAHVPDHTPDSPARRAKNPYKKKREFAKEGWEEPEFPEEDWENEAHTITPEGLCHLSQSTTKSNNNGAFAPEFTPPCQIIENYADIDVPDSGRPSDSISAPSKSEILLAVKDIFCETGYDDKMTPAQFYELIPVHFGTQVHLDSETKREVRKILIGLLRQKSKPTGESKAISNPRAKSEHEDPQTEGCSSKKRAPELSPKLQPKSKRRKSKPNDETEPETGHEGTLNKVQAAGVGESPVFEIGNSQLGPSQPIVSEDKRKGISKSKRFSNSSKLASPGNSRHAKECMCAECDPDGKKKEKMWPTASNIRDYFDVVSRPYGNMKNLTPTQRATQRGIHRRQCMQETGLDSLPQSSGLVRTKYELPYRERPQASLPSPLCQTERVTEADHNQIMKASQTPTDKIQADKYHDNGYSFLNNLENRAKSGELEREKGRKTSCGRNPFILYEVESSDTDEYESDSVENYTDSDREEDVKSSKSNLDTYHSQDSDGYDEDFIDNMDYNKGKDLNSLMDDAAGHRDSEDVNTSLMEKKLELQKKRSSRKNSRRNAARESIHRDKMKRQRGQSLLGHTVEVTPENVNDDHVQRSSFAVGSTPVNFARATDEASSESDGEEGQRKLYTGPLKTPEDERDVSDSDKERPGSDDELVDTDDGGQALLGHAVEVTPDDVNDDRVQRSSFAVGPTPVNLASVMEQASCESDGEEGQRKMYTGPFKTAKHERDVSDSDKKRPGLDDKLVDTDDESVDASVDSIGVDNDQQDNIVDSMNEAPHIFWGYKDQSSKVPIDYGGHVILPGDMLVFFDNCVHLDEFCGDESEIIDVYGINHSLVYFEACVETGSRIMKFVFDGVATSIDQDRFRNLFVKVYRQDERGQWLGAFKNNEKPWQGWLRVSQLKVDHSPENRSVVSPGMKDSAEKFMVRHFKPAYQRFVRRMRKWNAMYVRALGLADQSTRPSIENECDRFNANRFRGERPDTLARITSHIGNDQFGGQFDRRSLSLLYILLRHFNGMLIPDSKK